MAMDHAEFLSEEFANFFREYGFPYMRMDPAILAGEVDKALAAPEERLLLVLHCHSAELLVVSTRRIIVYTIPAKSSGIASTAKFVATIPLLFIPGVGELYEGFHRAKELFHLTAKLKHWVSPSDRREAAQRKHNHMPSREDGKDVVWDLRDAKILSIVTGYRNRILLENGFGWKTNFEVSLEQAGIQLSEITIGSEAIEWKTRVHHAPKYPRLKHFAKDKLDPVAFLRELAEQNRQMLETAGWSVEIDAEKVAFKKRLDSIQCSDDRQRLRAYFKEALPTAAGTA
jgi:hypothetical protein